MVRCVSIGAPVDTVFPFFSFLYLKVSAILRFTLMPHITNRYKHIFQSYLLLCTAFICLAAARLGSLLVRHWCVCARTAPIHSVAYFSAPGLFPSHYSRGWAVPFTSALSIPPPKKCWEKKKKSGYSLFSTFLKPFLYNLDARGQCHFFLSQTQLVLTHYGLGANVIVIIRLNCQNCCTPQNNLFRQALLWLPYSLSLLSWGGNDLYKVQCCHVLLPAHVILATNVHE